VAEAWGKENGRPPVGAGGDELQFTRAVSAMVDGHAGFEYTRGDGLSGRGSWGRVPSGHRRVEKPSLYWNCRCSMEQFDTVAEATELTDHSGRAPLLGFLTDRWAAFLVMHSFMQNLPD